MTYRTRRSGYRLELLFFTSLAGLLLVAGLGGCGGDEGGEAVDEADLAGLPPLPEVEVGVLQQVQGRLQTGFNALRQGQTDMVLRYFSGAHDMISDGAMMKYYLAIGHAGNGDPEQALAALAEGAELGLCNVPRVDGDPFLEETRALDGWPAVREKIRANFQTFRDAYPVSYRRLDPKKEPKFETLEELKQHYDAQLGKVAMMQMAYADCLLRPHLWYWLGHKLAGLERYGEKKLDETERLNVDVEKLKSVGSYEDPQRTPWRASTVDIVVQVADAFMQQHTAPNEKEQAAVAAHVQARSKWFRARPSDLETLTDEQLAEGVELLLSVDTRYPGTGAALYGLYEAAEAIAARDGLNSERLRPVVTRFASYQNHPQMAQLSYRVLPYVLGVNGLPAFNVTDLKGRAWDSQNLGNRVILIDFWATWCAPCLIELPNLVTQYEKYHDRGFEILGISLDKPEQISADALRTWVAKRDMTWPIVYDEKAWATPAARAIGVKGIPFPVLVDRDGRVIAAGEGATAHNLAKELKALFGEG